MRLYLNGVLVATNAYTEQLFNDGPVQQAFLGRHLFNELDPFRGEMDGVHLWKTARTQDQIRADMSNDLTGREPGLVGIWDFDDPTNPGKDSSGHGADGKLVGAAKTVAETLPVIVTGRITDAAGHGLTNAYVEVRRADGVTSRAPANAEGNYALAIPPSERADLFATDGQLSAFRLGFQPSGESEQQLDWVLTGTGVDASSTGARAVPARSNADSGTASGRYRSPRFIPIRCDRTGRAPPKPIACCSSTARTVTWNCPRTFWRALAS